MNALSASGAKHSERRPSTKPLRTHGSYAWLTGRSQGAQMHYDLCALTLNMLVCRDPATESFVVPQDDCLETYY
jgi:hypothetical protein